MAVKLPLRAAMKVAIYDLDKTLVRKATFTPFLAFAARRLAPWRLLFLPVWIGLMIGYRAKFYDRTTLKTMGMKLMLGRQELSQLEKVGHAFATRHISTAGWIPEVSALVEDDRRQGARLVIATAAFEFYARAFARMLDIDTVIATRWDGRQIPGGNCYGEEKRRRVLEALGDTGLDTSLRFVSDSFADAPLLNEAQEAIFITSSARKANRAASRSWAVIAPQG